MPILRSQTSRTLNVSQLRAVIFGSTAIVSIGFSTGTSTSCNTLNASSKFISSESGATVSRRVSRRPVLRNRLQDSTPSLRLRPTDELTAAHLDRIHKTIEECMRWCS